jgi:predicted ester cyclase
LVGQEDEQSPGPPRYDGKDNSSKIVHKEETTMTRMTLSIPRGRLRQLCLMMALASMVVLSGLLPVGAHGQTGGETSALNSVQNQNMELFRRYIEEVWNAGDTTGLDELLTNNHVSHSSGLQDVGVGMRPVHGLVDDFRTAFPDWRFTVEAIAVSGDDVLARLRGTGTHSGPLVTPYDGVIAPSGQTMTLFVIVDARFDHGKIIEQWFEFDAAALLRQLRYAESGT